MHNIFIEGSIGEESFKKFIEDVNQVPDKSHIVVYLRSYGGCSDFLYGFKDIIERHQMRLVALEKIYSTALFLFLLTNTPRTVMDNALGLTHRGHITNEGGINMDGKPFFSKKLLKFIKVHSDKEEKLVHKFLELTPKEIKRVEKDKDIFISTKRLRTSLKNSEKHFENRK